MTKYRVIQIISLLLLAAMLASCSPASSEPGGPVSLRPADTQAGLPLVNTQDPGERAMGRYMEHAVSIPEDIDLSNLKSYNGMLYALSPTGMKLYSTDDLIGWNTVDTGLSNLSDKHGELRDFSIAPDGTLYIMYYLLRYGKTDDDLAIKTHLVRSENGEITEIPFEVKDGAEYKDEDGVAYKEMYPDNVEILPSGNFIIGSQMRGVILYAADGTPLNTFTSSEVYGFATYQDELALFMYSDQLVRVFSAETGESLRDIPLESQTIPTLLQYDSQGALYYATKAGIYRAAPGGTLWECIVDGNLCSLSKPSGHLVTLVFTAQDEPLILIFEPDGQGILLLRYQYNPTIPTEPAVTLNVYSLYNSEYLRQCASLFQSRFPDVMVKFNVALTGDNSITRDDAIRTLNMEVLGGKGPDLLLLDGLPITSYVEKGVLADLNEIIPQDGSLFENIVSTYRQGSSLPAVPLRFNIPAIWGDVEGIQSLGDIESWVSQNPDLVPFFDMSAQALIERFYLTCAPAWYDERGLLKQEAVEEFLSSLKAMRDPWEGRDPAVELYLKTNFSITSEGWNPYQGNIIEDYTGGLGYAYNEIGFISSMLRSGNSMMLPYGAIEQAGHGGFSLMPGQARNVYLPSSIIGVNAKTPNPDLAKEFVKLALELDPQKTDTEDGFPVHAEALDYQMQKDDAYMSFSFSSDDNRSLSSKWPDEAMRAQLVSLIRNLDTNTIPDIRVHDILIGETEKYFAGEMDLKQAAGNVVSSANAYLSE